MPGTTVVTGGAGFIGSHLVRRLVDRGHTVRVVERPGAKVEHLDPCVDVVFSDIRDHATTRRALAGAATVFHLAANPNLWVRDRSEFDAVNHRGTVNVLGAAIEAGARRMVHCSTESILTCAGQAGPIAEDVEVTEQDAVGPYCLSKLRAERHAMDLARQGHPVYVGNPTMPVGPGDLGGSPPTRLILDCALGRLPAVMDCTLNVVDVRLVAEGLARIPERGEPGRRYLLGGDNLTLVSLLEKVARLTGSTLPRARVPYPVALGFAWLSEAWADHVTGRSPRASVTGVRLTRRTMHFDSSRSLDALGLRPVPIDDALESAIDWMRQNGQLPPVLEPSRPASTPG